MARRKKVYDDDDGRTIADMSGITPQRLFLPKLPDGKGREGPKEPTEGSPEGDRPWEADQYAPSKEERRWYMLGALKAALLIAAAFIAAFGLLIVLLILFWG